MNSTRNFAVGQILLLLAPYVLWFFLLRKFFSDQLALINDATVYYEHTKYYLDQIVKGVYPLWDPTRDFGIPNEFYLRRLGNYNPLLLIVVILDAVGLSWTQAYWCFLGFYVFLGVIGFYFLLKRIFREWIWAYGGYVMLLFSSFSLRIFDSNIFLIFVPIIWFFYFLVVFYQQQGRLAFLGMTFCLMMILTTYIPFYFLTILIWFLFCFGIIYWKEGGYFFRNLGLFIRGDKIFASFCVIVLCFACVPGYLLYKDGDKKEMILPDRHDDALPSENRFTISITRIKEGGVIPPVLLDEQFSGLKNFTAGKFYVPIIALTLLGMTLFNRTTRLTLAAVVFGMGLFMLSLSDAIELHSFLYQHVFFFKYFRNWHFFLWVALIPCMILICMDNLHSLSRLTPSLGTRFTKLVLVIAVHGGLIYWLNQFDDVLWSSYLMVLISTIFFVSLLLGDQKSKVRWLGLACFIFLVIAQSCEVFYYFARFSAPRGYYRYEAPYVLWPMALERHKEYFVQLWHEGRTPMMENVSKPTVYWGSVWANFVYSQMPEPLFSAYWQAQMIAYDQVEKMDDEAVDVERMRYYLSVLKNVAFVPAFYQGPLTYLNKEDLPEYPNIITNQSQDLQVLKTNSNYLKLKTNFLVPKFLVHNNSYHDGWRAFINHKPVTIWRANIAYRGVWIPAGEQLVEFRFGDSWRYVLNFLILFIFYVVFFYLLRLAFFNGVPNSTGKNSLISL